MYIAPFVAGSEQATHSGALTDHCARLLRPGSVRLLEERSTADGLRFFGDIRSALGNPARIGSASEADVRGFLANHLKIKERSTVARMRPTLNALLTYAAREKHVATHPVHALSCHLPHVTSPSPSGSSRKASPRRWSLSAASAHDPTITEWTSLAVLFWPETPALRLSDFARRRPGETPRT